MEEMKYCFECKFGANDTNEGKCVDCFPDPNRPHFEKAEPNWGLKPFDIVENPQHYCDGKHECIDVMENLFGTQAVIDFCKCNIFKYRFRAGKKNGDEDIKKAEWYEDKLMELNEKKARNADILLNKTMLL